jgi:hypothetical protein
MNSAGTRAQVHAADGLVVVTLGTTCAVVWRSGVIPCRFERQREALHEAVRRPGGASFLCIIEPTSTPPDAEMRKASMDMLDACGDGLRCVAAVVEGAGFPAAVVRGALTGIMLLRPVRCPTCVFSSISPAVAWIGKYVLTDDAHHLMRAIDDARARLPPYVPPERSSRR